MKTFLTILITLLLGTSLLSKEGDTATVQTFTFQDITKRHGVFQFPDGNTRWQKILMVRTLKCDVQTTHDQYPCGEWDYLTYTLVYIPKGNGDTTKELYELENFITPYGKRLSLNGNKGWSFIYDVTDYAPLLKGNVEISSGNQQELLDMKFYFIKGTSPRDVIGIENIYPWGKYDYGDLADNKILQQKNIILRPDAKGFKLKVRVSGHGQVGPYNCCEWDMKLQKYTWGDTLGREVLGYWIPWKDCGRNPIFPQGGTWPFDRAGWCPGTPVQTFEFDISDKFNPGDTITNFDYEIQQYTENGEKAGEFNMSHQIIYYGAPNFNNDACVEDIIAPNAYDGYGRDNPICGSPKIIVKNTGKNLLQSLDIVYGLKKGKKSKFKWNGQLKFLEMQEVYLPQPSWKGIEKDLEFTVTISNPNNMTDEYAGNNTITSRVPLPRVMPDKFKIHIETNDLGRAKEDSYTITDGLGKIIFSRGAFEDNVAYEDTLSLSDGCYTFLLTDTHEDGMIKQWWYSYYNKPELVGKNGKIMFMTLDNKVLQEMPYDFGQELRFCFRVGEFY
jgi:Peptide-N-glycosidase F, C terminal